jgi:probable F420-dependent oxidoreductase
VDLGRYGAWWSGWFSDDSGTDVAAEIEALGFGALWSSGGFGPGLSPHFERLLRSTSTIVVASGIVSIWTATAHEVAEAVAALDVAYPGRFLLGIGASHDAIVPDYARPYGRMVEYLDALDVAERPVAGQRRVLAALGPKMLSLAATRAAGAHPYFVPPEHTAFARDILGAGPLLAPEVTVVVDPDPATARATARAFTAGYLELANYAQNLRRVGFDEDDVRGGGSDRLVDAVIAWGGAEAIARRLTEHLDAGADHVCIQVVSDAATFPIAAYRELAGALFS